jgi:hypothetical protein
MASNTEKLSQPILVYRGPGRESFVGHYFRLEQQGKRSVLYTRSGGRIQTRLDDVYVPTFRLAQPLSEDLTSPEIPSHHLAAIRDRIVIHLH